MSIIMKKANRVAPARVDAHERTGPISLADITLQADERKASCLVDRARLARTKAGFGMRSLEPASRGVLLRCLIWSFGSAP